MSWYNIACDVEKDKKSLVVCYEDALVLLTITEDDENVENSIILYRDTVQNLNDRINEVIAKYVEMQEDKLKEVYELYIGDRTFLTLDPRYQYAVFTKYEKDESGNFDFLENSFIFSMQNFLRFLEEWEANVKHMQIHDMQSTCSPMYPCIEDACINCKMN